MAAQPWGAVGQRGGGRGSLYPAGQRNGAASPVGKRRRRWDRGVPVTRWLAQLEPNSLPRLASSESPRPESVPEALSEP